MIQARRCYKKSIINKDLFWNIVKMGVYIGSYISKIECDFTKSDCWFTFYGRTTSGITYGRDSNWLYLSYSSWLGWVAWSIPSSIYSKWEIKKIELWFYSTIAGNWWWISYQTDTQFSRIWNSWVSWATWFDNNWGTHTNLDVANTPSGWFTFTVDLENKLLSASYLSTTFSLSDSDISTIRNYWSNGNLNILGVLKNASNNKSYIQKAIFYY